MSEMMRAAGTSSKSENSSNRLGTEASCPATAREIFLMLLAALGLTALLNFQIASAQERAAPIKRSSRPILEHESPFLIPLDSGRPGVTNKANASSIMQHSLVVAMTNVAWTNLPIEVGRPLHVPYTKESGGLLRFPDVIGQGLELSVARHERLLADTNLDTNIRKSIERTLEDDKRRMAGYQTSAQLIARLREARASRDPDKISRGERELADYLIARLERIRGKKYPPGMSLTAVLKEYRTPGVPTVR